MRTFTGLDIVFKLLSGTLSGAAIETALADPIFLGPWREILKTTELNALLNSPTALTALFASETAFSELLNIAGDIIAASDASTELICESSSALLTIVSSATYLNLWTNTPANKTRMFARANQARSKLLIETFSSTGTWTRPAGGVLAIGGFAVAIGGTGGAANGGTNISGQGGSGAESGWFFETETLPAGDLAVTLGAAGSDTVIQDYLTVEPGVSGSATASPVTGAGTTAGEACYDTAFESALFQLNTGTQAGGNGGAGSTNPGSGGSGASGPTGSGGAAGGYNVSSPFEAYGGQPGTGIGSGGGGGGNSGGTASQGQNATASGCGAGGGAKGTVAQSGGTPGPAKATIYAVAA